MATQTRKSTSRRKSINRARSSNGSTQAGASTASRSKPATDQNVEAAVERIRAVNERMIESANRAGTVYLDLYEKTLGSIADYEDRLADSSQVEWIATVASAQASLTRDVAGAYSSAARSLLK